MLVFFPVYADFCEFKVVCGQREGGNLRVGERYAALSV